MSNIYIAARFSRRPEANRLAWTLKMLGHSITSRWVLPEGRHEIPSGMSCQASDSERERFAMEDLDDVMSCDWMISLMEEPRGNGRGGRHVEFGIAIALQRRLIIIGPRETVFHHLPTVEHYHDTSEFLESINPEVISND